VQHVEIIHPAEGGIAFQVIVDQRARDVEASHPPRRAVRALGRHDAVGDSVLVGVPSGDANGRPLARVGVGRETAQHAARHTVERQDAGRAARAGPHDHVRDEVARIDLGRGETDPAAEGRGEREEGPHDLGRAGRRVEHLDGRSHAGPVAHHDLPLAVRGERIHHSAVEERAQVGHPHHRPPDETRRERQERPVGRVRDRIGQGMGGVIQVPPDLDLAGSVARAGDDVVLAVAVHVAHSDVHAAGERVGIGLEAELRQLRAVLLEDLDLRLVRPARRGDDLVHAVAGQVARRHAHSTPIVGLVRQELGERLARDPVDDHHVRLAARTLVGAEDVSVAGSGAHVALGAAAEVRRKTAGKRGVLAGRRDRDVIAQVVRRHGPARGREAEVVTVRRPHVEEPEVRDLAGEQRSREVRAAVAVDVDHAGEDEVRACHPAHQLSRVVHLDVDLELPGGRNHPER